jgi:hypothetical protein
MSLLSASVFFCLVYSTVVSDSHLALLALSSIELAFSFFLTTFFNFSSAIVLSEIALFSFDVASSRSLYVDFSVLVSKDLELELEELFDEEELDEDSSEDFFLSSFYFFSIASSNIFELSSLHLDLSLDSLDYFD